MDGGGGELPAWYHGWIRRGEVEQLLKQVTTRQYTHLLSRVYSILLQVTLNMHRKEMDYRCIEKPYILFLVQY